jgi:hypothetical protein
LRKEVIMADNTGKVLYAGQDVTVHESMGKFETQFGTKEVVNAVVVRTGDTFPYDKLTDYQKEAVDNGELPGVEVLSQDEADKRSAEVAKLRAFVEGTTTTYATVGLSGPDAQDGSFSDHLLSDAERVANHVARADEEAGEAGPDDQKVTVAGAETDNSPANSGLTTGTDVGEDVQGSAGVEAAPKAATKSAKAVKGASEKE